MTAAAELLSGSAAAMAAAVRCGDVSAVELAQASLARIEATDGRVNAFTEVTAARALAGAAALDRRIAQRDAATLSLPLLGVPYAVKNLFDVAGLATLAGSKIERQAPPAAQDGLLVQRMDAAGAVLVGALNMDEYAYGFTTENSHQGPTRNPHDLTRVAGGSSGGSAAAVAAGQVPITLGSDTNGSIRVPSSLCGVFGLKPTFGRLPRSGSYPFVASLDHLGPFARSAVDLALAYDALQGFDANDPACVRRPFEPTADGLDDDGYGDGHDRGDGDGDGDGNGEGFRSGNRSGSGHPDCDDRAASGGRGGDDRGATSRRPAGIEGLRIAVLGGYFEQYAGPAARAAVARVAAALGVTESVDWPAAEVARAAAFLITNAQGAALHLPDLRQRAADFEPLSRDRFLAGALLPAAWVQRAQRVRRAAARQAAELLGNFDVLLAPATPLPAPQIGTEWIELNGQRLPARPNLGLLAQPISCIGLPVCTVPVWGTDATVLPIGVQVIAAPWREAVTLRVAAALQRAGAVGAPIARLEDTTE